MQDNRQMLGIEQIHEELLDILCRFDAFCRAHGLEYSLIAGTLLGAVRHGAFIPWDDDADVGMFRSDYNRLLSIRDQFAEETGLCILGYAGLEPEDAPYCRIANTRIRMQQDALERSEYLAVDLSPFDNLPTALDWTIDLYKKLAPLRLALATLVADPEKGRTPARRMVKRALAPLHRSQSLKVRISRIINNYATSVPYECSAYVGSVAWGLGGPAERIMRTSFMVKTDIMFEGRRLMVMQGWEEYLTSLYGGAFILDPPDFLKRDHGTKAWRIGEEDR